jgi:RNA polymerase sigma factor (TIGR02999 family)
LQPGQGEITILLTKWNDGEPEAFEQLFPLVYPHLRRVAASYVRRERKPDLMQATSLVHELYFKLLSQDGTSWEDRSHFYAFSAKVMRRILIDQARTNQADRHGGNAEHVPLNENLPWIGLGSAEMLQLNTALEALALVDGKKVQLIELRYFLGCTAEETAELAGISKATVDRELKYAKAWLYRRIDPEGARLAQNK